MSWLTEGPLSGMFGGDGSNRSSAQSGAMRGARYGAAAGPLGMAVGAAAGWLQGRMQQGRIARNSAQMASDASTRAGQGVNWAPDSDSPLSQFTPSQSAEPAESPASNRQEPETQNNRGMEMRAKELSWSGVMGQGANGETLIRGVQPMTQNRYVYNKAKDNRYG